MPELILAAPGSPDWLAARRQGVTATDIVTILGLCSWSSPYSLYWQKLGQVPEVPDSDRFRLGRELESYVVSRWEENSGLAAYPGGLYRHGARTWQLATLDRKVGPLLPDYPIEVKTWADAARDQWDDGPPPAVRAQVLWQMDVMGAAAGHVGVVFLPSGEFRSYVIEHDPVEHDAEGCAVDDDACTVCEDLAVMLQAGREWQWNIEHFKAPDPDASAATLAAVRARFTRQPDKQAEIDGDTWEAWTAHRDLAGEHERVARGLESQLREQAGEASVLTVDGQPVARRIMSDQQVKAHTRHMDYLRRIKTETNGDE